MDLTIEYLREQVIKMGSTVEAILACSLKKDVTLQETFKLEEEINHYHMTVDDSCFKFIALKKPFAKDLRTAIAIIKINSDLERMGDQALNIKRCSLKLSPDLPALNSLFEEVKLIVKHALDSFVHHDIRLAMEVIKHDEIINELNRSVIKETVTNVDAHKLPFDDGFLWIRMSKNLERIGDHATNIAEDVIFLESGEDIRHTKNKGLPPQS